MSTPEKNLERLEWLVWDYGGLLPALRIYTGLSTNAMCARLSVQRTSVHIMASRWRGRREETTRRALETKLGLPPYGLDTILDKET